MDDNNGGLEPIKIPFDSGAMARQVYDALSKKKSNTTARSKQDIGINLVSGTVDLTKLRRELKKTLKSMQDEMDKYKIVDIKSMFDGKQFTGFKVKLQEIGKETAAIVTKSYGLDKSMKLFEKSTNIQLTKAKELKEYYKQIDNSIIQISKADLDAKKLQDTGVYGPLTNKENARLIELKNIKKAYQDILKENIENAKALGEGNDKLSEAIEKEIALKNEKLNQLTTQNKINIVTKERLRTSQQEKQLEKELNILKRRTGDLVAFASNKRNTPEVRNALQQKEILEDIIKNYEKLRDEKSSISNIQYDREIGVQNEKIKEQRNEVSKLHTELAAQGKWLLNIKESFTQAFRSFTTYMSVTTVFYSTLRSINAMITETKELDKAFTSIQMVTRMSNNELVEYKNTLYNIAKETNSTMLAVANSADVFLRQGKNAAETAQLIESTNVFAKIAVIDTADAANLLTSSMNGLNIESQDTMKFIDKLAKVDIEAATSMQELATAMQYTASSAGLAGVSTDRLIGYIATVSETTRRGAESIGQSFKTIFARMQSVKIGSLTDEDGEDVSNVEKVLRQYNITLRDTKGNFRELDTVFDEINKKWKDLNQAQQSEIATTIAGVRQRENFIVLMERYDRAMQLTTESINSAGTAMETFSIFGNSIESSLNNMENEFQKFSESLMGSNFIKILYDLGTVILKLLNNEAGQFAIKGLAIASVFALLVKGGSLLGGVIKTLVAQTIILTNAQLKNVLADKTQIASNVVLKKTMQDVIRTELEAALIRKLGNEEQAKKIAADAMASASNLTLAGTFKVLAVSIWSTTKAFLASPFGWVTLAAGALVGIISLLAAESKKAKEKVEELQQQLQDSKNEISQLNDELKTTMNRIKELSEKDDLTILEKDELKRLQKSNQALETRIALLQKQQEITSIEADKATMDLYNQDFGKSKSFMGGYINGENSLNVYSGDISSKIYEPYRKENKLSEYGGWLSADEALKLYMATYKKYKSEGKTNYKEFKEAEAYITKTGVALVNYSDKLVGSTDDSKKLKEETQNAANEIFKILDPDKFRVDTFNGIMNDKTNTQAIKDFANLTEEQAKGSVELDNLMKKYPELADKLSYADIKLIDFYNSIKKTSEETVNAKDKIKDFEDAINDLVSGFDLLAKVQNEVKEYGVIDPRTLADIAEKYTDLSDELADYSIGLRNNASIIDLLKQKNTEYENSMTQSLMKNLQSSESFYQELLRLNSETINSMIDQYGLDTEAFTTVEGLKLQISAAAKNENAKLTDAELIEKAKLYGVDLTNYANAQKPRLLMMSDVANKLLGIEGEKNKKYSVLYKEDLTNFGKAQKLKADMRSGLEDEVTQAEIDAQIAKINELANSYVATSGNIKKISADLGKVNAINAEKNSKNEKDLWKEAYESELKDLQYNRDKGIITERQYYDSLESLNNKYFAGREKYLDDYRKNEIEILNARKKYVKEDFDKELKEWKYFLDAKYISQIEYYNKLNELNEKYLKNSTDYLDDYRQNQLEVQKGLLEEQQSMYDKAYNAINQKIEEEIEAIQDSRKAIEERYNKEIEAKKKSNDETDRAIELAKAEERLANARKEKNKRVYRQGVGWVWEADQQEISDAQKSLDDLKREDEISKLEDARDAELAIIDDQIAAWEKYKSLWEDMVDVYENEADKLAAAQIFGADWEKQLLNDRVVNAESSYQNYLGVLQNFYNEYLKIQQKINNVTGIPVGVSQPINNIGSSTPTGNSTSTPASKTHMVVGGDNLTSIAKKYNTTWEKIYEANRGIIGGNPNMIRPGQNLTIPSYSNGIENGVVDFTGLAMMHGSKANPEYNLNSRQMSSLVRNLATMPASKSKNMNNGSNVHNYHFDNLSLPNVQNAKQFLTELKSIVNISKN